MRVTDVQLKQDGHVAELSALMDDFHLWYRFHGLQALSNVGDVFLAAGLLPAMRSGRPLEIPPEIPVSRRLMVGVNHIQDIFCSWDTKFQKVKILASSAPSESRSLDQGSFFSGGVDGIYSFLKHREEISHLIFVKGVDMQVDNHSLFDEALGANRRFCDHYGKTLIPVESNVRFFGHSLGLNWPIYHGSGLASLALATGMQKVYVAATHTYTELFPWGSHPLTDPFWSNESTEVVHDGAEAARTQKLKVIAGAEMVLETLRVCWQDRGYNCGECEKCLRTMMTLRLLGITCPTFPPLTSVSAIKRLRIDGENDLAFVLDNLLLATERGDTEIERALRGCLRKYRIRQLARTMDQELLGGRVKRWLVRGAKVAT